jgi:cation transport ATPase
MADVVFIDVDDTLIRTFSTKRIPITHMVDKVCRLHEEGAELYLWSSGGADYARASAQELGIEKCFAGFLPKPDLYIDDQPIDKWRCKHVYPSDRN